MRFQKRIKIFPGLTLNLSKSGASVTAGVKGLSVNVGKNGTFLNTGLPGTGLSKRQKLTGPKKSRPPRHKVGRLAIMGKTLSLYEDTVLTPCQLNIKGVADLVAKVQPHPMAHTFGLQNLQQRPWQVRYQGQTVSLPPGQAVIIRKGTYIQAPQWMGEML